MPITITALKYSPSIIVELSEILIQTVASGGSVSFMYPLPMEVAERFWQDSLAAADRGERIVLGAFDEEELVGTVTLQLALPPNQPHRAEVAKMMVRLSHRRRGIGTALMRKAEALALKHGRMLLVLDTAVDDGASQLYEALGFKLSGIIPNYAFKPHGGLTGTMIYWKHVAAMAEGVIMAESVA